MSSSGRIMIALKMCVCEAMHCTQCIITLGCIVMCIDHGHSPKMHTCPFSHAVSAHLLSQPGRSVTLCIPIAALEITCTGSSSPQVDCAVYRFFDRSETAARTDGSALPGGHEQCFRLR